MRSDCVKFFQLWRCILFGCVREDIHQWMAKGVRRLFILPLICLSSLHFFFLAGISLKTISNFIPCMEYHEFYLIHLYNSHHLSSLPHHLTPPSLLPYHFFTAHSSHTHHSLTQTHNTTTSPLTSSSSPHTRGLCRGWR